ncbi:MAG: 4Fe-4S dicluster domain-containing protein, partial [Bifidobacteriaceae bacterium]|nr:4Fe-4S dicluster domain-containing protein [Bifidobacteriaceae bacterium]
DAADAVPAILPHQPLAVEGLDSRLLEAYRLQVGQPPELPQGGAWLMVEAADPGQAELIGRAGGTPHVRVLPFGPESRAMWRIRQDGAGLAGRSPRGRQSYPGFEDAAVPPGRLGSYLRRFEELLAEFDLEGIPYGHLGDGCVHIRIDFPFDRGPAPSGSPGGGVRPGRLRFGGAARHSGTRPGPAKRGTPRRGAAVAPSGADGSGVTEAGVITAGVGERSGARVFREFMAAAGALAVEHGGSLSGEHGDGRSRSELLALMYTPAAVSLMEQVKGLFDPWNQLNPGIGPRPVQLDADLRRPASRPLSAAGGFTFGQDQGDLTKAAHRCTGVAKCQAAAGPFMCPSFLATGQEKDSTRGRARILQEVANGSLIGPGFDAPELAEVLKLCLACKACSKDCPAAVDMAKLKSEALFRRYRGKPRPIVHYLLGWLPRWEALAARNPALANFALHAPLITKALLRAGGMDPRRSLPRFAAASFQTQAAVSGFAAAADTAAVRGPSPVVVWGDSFSSKLAPGVGQAVARVLAAAGHTVHIAPEGVCCGLTWITTGQLGGAKRRLRSLLDVLGPFAVNGVPIVGVEPSCLAALRSDLPDLLATDPRAAVVARATKTLAEVLTADLAAGWRGPSLDGVEVVAQPHCHHHSVMGWEADRELLTRLGAQVQELHGCCGMAGNFGMERGNYEVSVKIAQGSLLPALADASEAVFLADGFSCRTQAADLAGRDGKHLAELLADRLDDAV